MQGWKESGLAVARRKSSRWLIFDWLHVLVLWFWLASLSYCYQLLARVPWSSLETSCLATVGRGE